MYAVRNAKKISVAKGKYDYCVLRVVMIQQLSELA